MYYCITVFYVYIQVCNWCVCMYATRVYKYIYKPLLYNKHGMLA